MLPSLPSLSWRWSPRAALTALLCASSLAAPASASAEAANFPAGPARLDGASFSAGNLHACAILATGALRCWGYQGYWQLGYGEANYTGKGYVPRAIDDLGDTVNDVGDNELPSAGPTVPLGTGRTAVQVAAGSRHTCALLDNAKVICWGLPYDIGSTAAFTGPEPAASASAPVALPAGRTVDQLVAGSSFSCALLDNGSINCWGSGSNGVLGNGSFDAAPASAPGTVALPAGRKATAISSHGASTCAILDDGTVACWGSADRGALQNGSDSENVGDAPGETARVVQLPAGRRTVALASGYAFHCAVLDNGAVYCWGDYTAMVLQNIDRQAGNIVVDHIGDAPGELPRQIPLGGTAATSIFASSGASACAVLQGGAVRCWGGNLGGELGLGTAYYLDGGDVNIDASVGAVGDDVGEQPIAEVAPAGTTINGIDGSSGNLCFLLSDSSIRCLGGGGLGGVGTPTGYGGHPGESLAGAPAAGLGARIGRDTDGDGVRDAIDGCPNATFNTTTGCASGTSDTTPPTVPGTPSFTNVTATSATVSWGASTDAGGAVTYEVFVNGASKGTPTATSLNLTGLTASTSYAVTVKARDPSGNVSAASAAGTLTTMNPPDTTPPTVPGTPTFASITATAATVSWAASTDASGVASYEVFIGGVSKGTSATNTFNLTGLTNGTTYAVTVKAKDPSGNVSAASAAGTLKTLDTSAPSAPTGVSATGVTPAGNPTITWTASTDNVGVASYEVFLNGASKGTSTSTSLALTGLATGTYAVTVKAKDAAGNVSAASAAFSLVIPAQPDTTAPTIPGAPTFANVTTTSATASWTASTDAGGSVTYEVFVNGASKGTSTTTSLNLTGLTASTTYAVTVKAKDPSGNVSAASATGSLTTLNPPDTTGPTTPGTPTFASITGTSATVSWAASTDPSGVASYEVFVDGAAKGTSTTTSFNLTGLAAATTYAVTVKAKDSLGNVSTASAAGSLKTLSTAPGATTPTGTTPAGTTPTGTTPLSGTTPAATDDAITLSVKGAKVKVSALLTPTAATCPKSVSLQVRAGGTLAVKGKLRTRLAKGTKARRCRAAGTLTAKAPLTKGTKLTLKFAGKGVRRRQVQRRVP